MPNLKTRNFHLIWIIFYALASSCKPAPAKVIVIQPYTGFNEKRTEQVLRQIREIYPNTHLKKAIPLPAAAYYPKRDRYRADSLIKFLSRSVGPDTLVIGMTIRDISATKDTIQDWGIMGLGNCPGNACVVSTFRLSSTRLDDQFYKVALHELGHCLGLKHCPNKTCLMRDAEGGNPLDQEKGFCPSCKSVLKAKGWNL